MEMERIFEGSPFETEESYHIKLEQGLLKQEKQEGKSKPEYVLEEIDVDR
jgi:hypothetical protein